MEILTFLATIASILGGLAILPKLFKWARRKYISARSTKKAQCKLVNIVIDKDFNLSMDDRDFQRSIKNLLFYVRSNECINLSIKITQLDEHRNIYNSLRKKNRATDHDLKKRNQLQIYFNHIDNRISLISLTLNTLLKYGHKTYLNSFSDADWSTIVNGVLENISQIGKAVNGSKIDIWRENPMVFSAPIYISAEEMDSILEKLDLSYSQQFIGNMGFLAGELPREILLSKAIPSIAVNIARKVIEMKESEAVSCYDPYGWRVGLG